MKKTIFVAIALLAAAPCAANAISPYFSAGGSLGIFDDSNWRSGGFSGAIGVKYKLAAADVRTEFEYSNAIYRKEYDFYTAAGVQSEKYDMDTQLFLLNTFVDFPSPIPHTSLNLGLTLGAANYKRNLPARYAAAYDANKTSPMFGATAGLAARLFAGLYVNAGVRYLKTLDTNGIDSLSPYFGLRYGF